LWSGKNKEGNRIIYDLLWPRILTESAGIQIRQLKRWTTRSLFDVVHQDPGARSDHVAMILSFSGMNRIELSEEYYRNKIPMYNQNINIEETKPHLHQITLIGVSA